MQVEEKPGVMPGCVVSWWRGAPSIVFPMAHHPFAMSIHLSLSFPSIWIDQHAGRGAFEVPGIRLHEDTQAIPIPKRTSEVYIAN